MHETNYYKDGEEIAAVYFTLQFKLGTILEQIVNQFPFQVDVGCDLDKKRNYTQNEIMRNYRRFPPFFGLARILDCAFDICI